MKVETVFRAIIDDWTRAKNHCRTTDNKDFTEKEPTDTFKKKLLISEHSPIRTLQYDWTWPSIPYWVSTHWSRHVWTPFISTQRDDRLHDEISRDEKPQGALVRFDGYANQQHLIDTWRKRLCYCASPETREYAEDFKIFCRKRSDADKIFQAVRQWLKGRLKLEINEEKSKVVNLKRHYSEFFGI